MKKITRRKFITTASAGSAAVASGAISPFKDIEIINDNSGKLAILGGTPAAPAKVWPEWPYIDEKVIAEMMDTAKSGIWCRIQSADNKVLKFENEFARLMGIKTSIATGSGTQSLNTCIEALGIGPGDEVITSPYTDPGTIASILVSRALPVLADLDPDSFQLDPDDVERRITSRTKALMPVHMMGQPCNMERIMEIAKKHKLLVIEDSAQAHFAEYQGKKAGLIGDVGCFSFQTSKVLSCGEGGGIVSNNEELLDKCYTVHNHGTSKRGRTETIGSKYRMNEFEAACLLGQLPGVMDRHYIRNRNAKYLTEHLKDCPGLVPQKLYPGTTAGSWYLYPWSYKKDMFNGAPREKFLKAIAAEGISLSPYITNGLHREPWTQHIQTLPVYRKMYGAARLRKFNSELHLPKCDQVCEDMVMLWASGPLLGTLADMDDLINAIMKVYVNRDKLNTI
ncbi:MAG TPA: DegT/DnrJ/EryC1/StrS family aminotransferase [Bacteroidales bacterium]|jgi:dTDP-4-amino-4,6-dideoxygalactose transaminase|nr:DegT/DnrJ/EryC1/StrS family aminotransferase [Bacteroidales bacterium]HOS71446.1 DegT/DnrJ/EryC1/StrS family aminotransferase [Bacteroidales bacterium]HQH25058.1 DegT/DnrJ/EryC1/StrS family aminotransferase [Bacteroidales bacterium]HQJ82418.1 DegT/DnrJ/EryC1/StrS family aminotransferase [Bacteroidales bacterium]